MTKITQLTTVIFICCLFAATICTAVPQSRGLKVNLKGTSGSNENVSLYQGSYALLIGVSKYYAGWPPLPSVPAEINEVEKLLVEQGFHVEKISDPTGTALESGFKTFINRYGLKPENRLLFFFSGHGHTRKNGDKGYLVPIDAPDPEKDTIGFLQRALGMNQVLSWARDIESKHALFLFDSCFSGTIFKQKSSISPPPYITRLTIEPVRQFITAGSAGEEVPSYSSFTPAFISALRHGHADLNNDGYVSATELGVYLQTELPEKTNQTPQFGKIRDYDLARGDFIFSTGQFHKTASVQPTTPIVSQLMPATPTIDTILRVNSAPTGAAVYMDDTYQGSTPLLLNNATPGSYNIRAEKKGFLSETRSIQLKPAKQLTLDFNLIALEAEGSLSVNTNPAGAKVSVLGFQQPYSPEMKIPAGKYSVEVTKHGFYPEIAKVEIRENEDMFLNITLKRQVSIATPDNQELEPYNTDLKKPDSPIPSGSSSVPSYIEADKKKVVYNTKPSLPADISGYIKDLRSKNSGTQRNTARIVYRKNIQHPAVMQAVVDELLKGATRNLDDKYHVDAMAWFCNILGNTGKKDYIKTLDTVANSDTNRKIRKYAAKNSRRLK